MKTLFFRNDIQKTRRSTAPAVLGALPPPAPHPAVTRYMGRLSAGSRRTQLFALDRIAALLSDDKSAAADFSWQLLTEEQTHAVRRLLLSLYKPATANRMIAALRGVLK